MNYSNKLLIVLSAAVLISCAEEENMDPIGAWTLSEAQLLSPDAGASIQLLAAQNQQEFTFSWAPAVSSEGYLVSYVLYMTVDTDTLLSRAADATETSFTAIELDNALSGFGIAPEEELSLTWSVAAYSLDKVSSSASRNITIRRFEDTGPPTQLYLVSGGQSIGTLELLGENYTSENYFPLQVGQSYSINTQANGLGTSYGAVIPVGSASNPAADKVSAEITAVADNSFTAARDQMYHLTLNLTDMTLSWQYYNMKLFHWDEEGGGWDQRQELSMTYVHPFTFTVSGELTAGYHSKFFSPWEVLFGSDTPTQLVGTMTNAESAANFDNITQSGTYLVTIEVASDYQTGSYAFELQ